MGVVPEHPALYDYLSAEEMIAFVAEIRGGGDVAWALEVAGLGQRCQAAHSRVLTGHAEEDCVGLRAGLSSACARLG